MSLLGKSKVAETPRAKPQTLGSLKKREESATAGAVLAFARRPTMPVCPHCWSRSSVWLLSIPVEVLGVVLPHKDVSSDMWVGGRGWSVNIF